MGPPMPTLGHSAFLSLSQTPPEEEGSPQGGVPGDRDTPAGAEHRFAREGRISENALFRRYSASDGGRWVSPAGGKGCVRWVS